MQDNIQGPQFVMLVGLPGSGKSTYAKKLAKDGYVIHSSDIVRAEIGDETDQKRSNEVFDILHRRIRNDLMSGKNVCMDATNLGRKKRMHCLRQLPICHKKCIIIATPWK